MVPMTPVTRAFDSWTRAAERWDTRLAAFLERLTRIIHGAVSCCELQPAMTPKRLAHHIRISAMRLKNFALNSCHGR
jgi:hypothetical protein